MRLESFTFEHNQAIPSKYTCDGENISPPLKIFDIPLEAKSLVLIVDDPDAPRGDWVHWTLWNIPPHIVEISENSVPDGVMQGMTDFGRPGWGGPCPPSGVHRYFFKIYALDIVLDISPASGKSELEAAMAGHIIDKSELIGLYSRRT